MVISGNIYIVRFVNNWAAYIVKFDLFVHLSNYWIHWPSYNLVTLPIAIGQSNSYDSAEKF